MRNVMFGVIGVLVVAACGPSTSGVDVNLNQVRSFKEGNTTAAQARKLLGAPKEIKKTSGAEIWTYSFTSAHMTGAFVKTMTSVSKVAVLGFDTRQRLVAAQTSEMMVVARGFSSGPDLAKMNTSQFKIGVARLKDVTSKFGAPQNKKWNLNGEESISYISSTTSSAKSLVFSFSDGLLTAIDKP